MLKEQLGIKKEKKLENMNKNLTQMSLFVYSLVLMTCFFYVYIFQFEDFIGLFPYILKDREAWAQFGDYFGGVVNPLIAFFAFVVLIRTVQLQSESLDISRKELSETRKELQKSAKAQEEQSESLKLQNKATNLQIFENTFFQLNGLFNNVKNGLSIKINIFSDDTGFIDGSGGQKTEYFGIDDNDADALACIKTTKFISYEVIEKYVDIYRKNYHDDYEEFNKRYEKYSGTYFGQAYQILKFIDNCNLKEEEKQRYINIFRAQFTKNELEFLFYHCLGMMGRRHFRKYVEKYEFFEHIILNNDIEKQLLEYDIKVFGKNVEIVEKYNELKSKAQ